MIPVSDGSDLMVGAVVLARLLLPLTILRYPLPGMILSAIVIDSMDRDVYLRFTQITQDDYQRIDKAFDAYYAVFAYLAMIRNWPSGAALRVGRTLFFYRLIGIAVFQLTGARWVLTLFPNAFDFFFLFYEAMRLRWRPEHLAARPWVGIAAGIALLTVMKEAWIHLAQLDVTDFVKEHLVGAPAAVPWSQVLREAPWLLLVGAALALLLFLAGRGLVRWLAPEDHPGTRRGTAPIDADAELGPTEERLRGQPVALRARPLRAVAEEMLLIALLTVVFTQALHPEPLPTLSFVLTGVVFVLANALAYHRRAVGGGRWRPLSVELGLKLGLAAVVVGAGVLGRAMAGGSPDLPVAAAFALGLMLLSTLYERALCVHRERFGAPHPPSRQAVR